MGIIGYNENKVKLANLQQIRKEKREFMRNTRLNRRYYADDGQSDGRTFRQHNENNEIKYKTNKSTTKEERHKSERNTRLKGVAQSNRLSVVKDSFHDKLSGLSVNTQEIISEGIF